MPHVDYQVLEQIRPDILITSSSADEKFMKICHDFSSCSTNSSGHAELIYLFATVDNDGGMFQIRPQREFHPERGLDRLLSIQFLSECNPPDENERESSHRNDPQSILCPDWERNGAQDPAMDQKYASIRLGNFSQSGPGLCVKAFYVHDSLSNI